MPNRLLCEFKLLIECSTISVMANISEWLCLSIDRYGILNCTCSIFLTLHLDNFCCHVPLDLNVSVLDSKFVVVFFNRFITLLNVICIKYQNEYTFFILYIIVKFTCGI